MEYSGIVPRIVRRARGRLTLEKSRGQVGSESEPRDPMGHIISDPLGDELPPMIPAEILLAQESFPALGPKWSATPNPNTPKRQAPDSSTVAPAPKAPRVETSSGLKGDQEYPNRHAASPPASHLIAVTTEQVQLAGREPNRGWPPYSVL